MTTKASQIVLNTQDSVAPIGIIAMNGAKELGDKINNYLVNWAQDSGMNVDSYMIETTCPRFSSGDAKGLIKEGGRSDIPGRPILYKITDDFLDYFGLSSKDDLPSIELLEEENTPVDLYTSIYKEDNNGRENSD